MDNELKQALHELLTVYHIGDYVYDVRERACETGEKFEGNSWDHPKVVRFAEIIGILKSYVP